MRMDESGQYLLELDWGTEPWEGYSPRSLCRGLTRVLSLQRERGENMSDTVAPVQFEMFAAATRVGSRLHGSPTLLPLPLRHDHG